MKYQIPSQVCMNVSNECFHICVYSGDASCNLIILTFVTILFQRKSTHNNFNACECNILYSRLQSLYLCAGSHGVRVYAELTTTTHCRSNGSSNNAIHHNTTVECLAMTQTIHESYQTICPLVWNCSGTLLLNAWCCKTVCSFSTYFQPNEYVWWRLCVFSLRNNRYCSTQISWKLRKKLKKKTHQTC